MKLSFDNNWMELYACSMRKLHKVTEIALNQEEKDKALKKDLITISSLEPLGISFLSMLYGIKEPSKNLEELSTDENPFLPFYIKVDKEFFQVAHIVKTVEEANLVMTERSDVALICSDNQGNHYLSSREPLRLKKIA